MDGVRAALLSSLIFFLFVVSAFLFFSFRFRGGCIMCGLDVGFAVIVVCVLSYLLFSSFKGSGRAGGLDPPTDTTAVDLAAYLASRAPFASRSPAHLLRAVRLYLVKTPAGRA